MSTYPRTSGTAVASLVFGVLSWCAIPIIGAIVAIVLGHSARGEIRRAPAGMLDGDSMATVGLVLGWLHILLALMALFVFVTFFGGLIMIAHWLS